MVVYSKLVSVLSWLASFVFVLLFSSSIIIENTLEGLGLRLENVAFRAQGFSDSALILKGIEVRSFVRRIQASEINA